MKNETDDFANLINKKDIDPLLSGHVTINHIVGIDNQGRPLVEDLYDTKKMVVALSTVSVNESQVNRQVILTYADGNPETPVILGLVHNPLMDIIENQGTPEGEANNAEVMELQLEPDGQKKELHIGSKKIVINAEDEIMLQCGESSITLTKAGKILIRGKYLLNRSSGVNRIVGGSVQVN